MRSDSGKLTLILDDYMTVPLPNDTFEELTYVNFS